MDHKLEFPTYEEMHEKAVKLAHLIKEKNIKFDKMVVVSRGGFVPASVVAYTLGIQDVDIVSIQSYIHREAGKAIVHRAPKTDDVVLVIDDIVDTGKTMFEILCLVNDMMPEDVKVVTLLKRKKDSPPVDHFCFEIGDEWVVGYGLDDNSLKRNYRNIYKLN